MPWKIIKKGTYNSLYIHDNSDKSVPLPEHKGGVILKIAKNGEDHLKRQVKIANLLYPDMPVALYKKEQDVGFPKVEVIESGAIQEPSTGFVMPYFQFASKPEDDEEVAKEILNIYRHKRRILLDGCNQNNFRRATKTGPLIAVSYDFARGTSPLSKEMYRTTDDLFKDFNDYWNAAQDVRPSSIKIIKTLLWLEEHIPVEDIKIEYLDYDFLMCLVVDNILTTSISKESLQALYILYKLDPSFIIKDYMNLLFVNSTLCETIIKHSVDARFSAVSCLELLAPSKMPLLKKLTDGDKVKFIHAMNKLISIFPDIDFSLIDPQSILKFYNQLVQDKNILSELHKVIGLITKLNAKLITPGNLVRLLADEKLRKSILDHNTKHTLSLRMCRHILEGKPINPEETWQPLASGAFNHIFFKKDVKEIEFKGPAVLKLKIVDEMVSDPERAIRVSKDINPTMSVALLSAVQDESFPHMEYHDESGKKIVTTQGWLMPHLSYDTTKDDDLPIAHEILAIYRKTKRIVVDGCGDGNFRKAEQKGPVSLVDYDWAFRRGSLTSMKNLTRITTLYAHFHQYWKSYESIRPNSVKIIRALVWLDSIFQNQIIPDEYLELDFLKLFIAIPPLTISTEQLTAAYALYKINPYLVTHENIVILSSRNLREKLLKSAKSGKFTVLECLELLHPKCEIFKTLDKRSLKSMLQLVYRLGYLFNGMNVLQDFQPGALHNFNKYYQNDHSLFDKFERAFRLLDEVDSELNHITNCHRLLFNFEMIEQIIKSNIDKTLTKRRCLIILIPPAQKHFAYCIANRIIPLNLESALLRLSINFPELDVRTLTSEFLCTFSEEFTKDDLMCKKLESAVVIIRNLNPKLLTRATNEKLLKDSITCQHIISAERAGTLSVINCEAILTSSLPPSSSSSTTTITEETEDIGVRYGN